MRFLLIILLLISTPAMAQKFSALPEDSSPSLGDYTVTVETASGQNRKVLLSAIKNLVTAGLLTSVNWDDIEGLKGSLNWADEGAIINSNAINWQRLKQIQRADINWEDASLFPISATGNVGIGSPYPSSKLDINGTAKALAFIGDGSRITNMGAVSTITVCASNKTGKYLCDYTADGTNDQTEINNAINAATALATGGKVFLTEGNFYISASIVPKPNVWLQGAGRDQTKLYGDTGLGNTAIIYAAPSDYSAASPLVNFKVSSMYMDGTNMDHTGYHVGRKAVFMQFVRGFVAEDLYLYNTPATCMGVDFFFDGRIQNNIVDSCGTAGQGEDGGSNGIGAGTVGSGMTNENVIITGNIAKNVANYGIMVESQSSGTATVEQHVVISNNNAYLCRTGFNVAGNSYVTVTGNNSWANTEWGFQLSRNQSGTNIPHDVIIANNTFNENGVGGMQLEDESANNISVLGNNIAFNAGRGILTRVSRSIYADNNIHSNDLEGIKYISSSSLGDIVIQNNTIWNNGQAGTVGSNDGINIAPNAGVLITNMEIKNNYIYDQQGSPTQRYGINLNGNTITQAKIILNTGRGNTGGLFNNTSSTSYYLTSYDNGNIGIGKVPTTALDVNGTITATAFAGQLSANVGINTVATKSALEIQQSVNSSAGGFTTTNVANNITTRIWSDSAGARISGGANDTSPVYINGLAGANVGIGTVSTPGQLLEVSDAPGTSASVGFRLSNRDGRKWDLLTTGSSSSTNPNSLIIRDASSSSNRLIIDSGGNLGISTTLPRAFLDISSTANQDLFVVRDNGGSDTTPFVITATGNVGIGSATPNGALVVRTSTSDIGWTPVNAPNQACNTTCTASCVFGIDTAAIGNILPCTDATADSCLCAGSN